MIIMGVRNYQNNLYQLRDNKSTDKYDVIKGIQLENGNFVGNTFDLTKRETGAHRLKINNGIIVNEDTILINGYPPCLEKRLTRDMKENLKLFLYDHKRCPNHVFCTTIQNAMYVIKEKPSSEEIFTSKITKWDACCRLEYKECHSDKNIFLARNNNFIEGNEPGDIRKIINLGAAHKYIDDDDNKVIWRRRDESGESDEDNSLHRELAEIWHFILKD